MAAMLQRQASGSGVVWYASPALRAFGVPHAFSTRLGGVSPAPFDSLNLGNPSGAPVQDSPENLAENHRRVLGAAGLGPAGELCRVHQVHGPAVHVVLRGHPHDPHAKADAVATDDPGRIASVRVADCVPVLLATAGGAAVAAVHAGWRGVISGVVGATIDALQRLDAGEVVAAIGPGIGPGAFEVGPEVVVEFRRVFGTVADTVVRPGAAPGKSLIDLPSAIDHQLRSRGVNTIDTTDRCTFRDAEEFYSHRRDKGITGRMAAFISPRSG